MARAQLGQGSWVLDVTAGAIQVDDALCDGQLLRRKSFAPILVRKKRNHLAIRTSLLSVIKSMEEINSDVPRLTEFDAGCQNDRIGSTKPPSRRVPSSIWQVLKHSSAMHYTG